MPWNVKLDPTDGPSLTNLIQNPSAEYDTAGTAPAGWPTSATTSATITTWQAQTGWSFVARQSFRLTVSMTASGGSAFRYSAQFPVTAGLNYALLNTLNIKSLVTGADMNTYIVWYNGSGGVISQQGINGGGLGIKTVSGIFKAPAGAVNAAIKVGFESGTATGTCDGYFDAVLAAQSDTVPTYFDGDSAGAPASKYQWTGTPGNSASTRTTTRTTLDLNTGPLRIEQAGIDWGDGAVQQYLADQKHGSPSVDLRLPNRTITIPLGLGMDESQTEETARRQLEQKVGLIQREGGWLLRQRDNGPALYCDIVDAILQLPDQWGETGLVEQGSLLLTCLPDFYGDEVALDPISGNKYILGKLKLNGNDAVIAGDYEGRTRIKIWNNETVNINALVWAFRSRRYDPASSAALVKTASQLPLLNASTLQVESGAIDGHAVENTNISRRGWVPICELSVADVGANNGFTHKGTYSVIARVKGNPAPTHLRLLWQVGDLGVPEENEPVEIPDDASSTEGGASDFYEMDLGQVHVDAPPTSGNYCWYGMIQARTHQPSSTVRIDSIIFVPTQEAAGLARAKPHFDTPEAVGHDSELEIGATLADDASVGGQGWSSVNGDGDLPFSTTQSPGSGLYAKNTEYDTHYFKATNLGFVIPAGATITGIRLEVQHSFGEARVNKRGHEPYVQDKNVRIIKAGLIASSGGKSRQKRWPHHSHWEQYGDTTDLWGQTWTPADINNSGFGFAISAQFGVATTGDVVWPRIDNFRLRVYYKGSASGTVQKDAVIYGSQSAEVRTDGVWHLDPTGNNPVPASETEGDEPRIPPSGLEGRPCELLVYVSRGDHRHRRHHRHHRHDPDTSPSHNLKAQVFYRPAYLGRI